MQENSFQENKLKQAYGFIDRSRTSITVGLKIAKKLDYS